MANLKFYPATTVTNIETAIPITLDLKRGQYNNWATLFKLHALAHLVLDHIIPPTEAATTMTDAKTSTCKRIDAFVTQWIYSTVSSDILNTIIILEDEAKDAWNRVAELFQDNKNTRAVHLETQFTNTHLRDFPNVVAYCQRLKVLADQLENISAKVSDDLMVLKMIHGLKEAYAGFVTIIQHRGPLPTFAQARSMLSLEEESMKQRATLESGADSTLLINSNNNLVSGDNNSKQLQENKNENSNSISQNHGGCGWRPSNYYGSRGGLGNRGGSCGRGQKQHSAAS
ncbi:uncharacterized protein LOC120206517 [Hibiscus syriacus]|uniref:uncharacterized protein LOC120162893 n=1 Tax=Hibiscus syriacus TaxID=106335 RepID=UPI0019229C66|nr:uncharacterized protein LOC120162893 [Hibiscus syriacus]XP_039062083.1 uncharacterized protein LOC120206517 [Hibiscus syriacus]